MTEAIVGVIGVLLGTALGFGLNEYAGRKQEARTEKMQVRSVRTIVSLEIEENLRLLWQFWRSVEALPDEADRDAMNFSRRLIQVPLPGWSHGAWESQLSSLAAALTAREIRQVHVHHNRLERITAIRAQLEAFAATQRDEWMSAPDAGGVVRSVAGLSRVFDWNAPELWAECERGVEELRETGNPLPEEAKQLSYH